MRVVTYGILTLSLCSWLQAAQGEGFEFLRFDSGARSGAMGGAMVASLGDVEQAAVNPAILSLDRSSRFIFSWQAYLADLRTFFVGLEMPMAWGQWAAYGAYLDYGEIQRTDVSGQDLGTFRPGDFLIGLSVADSLKHRFHWGIGGSYLRSSIDGYTSDVAVLHAGLLIRIPSQLLRLGLSLQNFGKAIRPFQEVPARPPTSIRLGFSKHLAHLPLMVNGDVIRYVYRVSRLPGGVYFALGGEFTVTDHLFLRFGYHSRGREERIGAQGGRMAGLGFGFGIHLPRLQIDYAYGSYGVLGETHQLTARLAGRALGIR